MDIIWVALGIVATIFLLIGMGIFFAWRGWMSKDSTQTLSFLVTKVGLPALVIYNIVNNYTREGILGSMLSVVVPLITMAVNYLVAVGVAKLFRVDNKRRGVFCAMFTFSNTMFIGLPVNIALFGEQTVPYTMLYYMAQTFLFWTVGIAGIRRDGDPSTKMLSWSGIKKVFSIPLIAFFIGVILVLLGVKLPSFINNTLKYTSSIVTALSLFYTGIVLFYMGLRKIHFDRALLLMCVGRFIISPALVIGMNYIIPLAHNTLQTFLIQASLPIMAQTPIFAGSYGADSEYAAQGVLLTTIVSIITIPIYAYIGTVI